MKGTTEKTWRYAYTLSNNTWYHLAWVYNASATTATLYVNGSSVANDNTFPSSITNSSGNFSIGDDDDGYGLRGKIDEVRVWNDVRTGTEISNNYQAELAGTEANLVSYWKFSENFTDETNNNNDLTTTTITEATTTNKSIDLEKDSSQYLSIADISQTGLDLTVDCSFEAWVKFETIPDANNNSLITKIGGDGVSYAFTFVNAAGDNQKIEFYYTANGSTYNFVDSADLNYTTGIWTHFAITFIASSATVEFYMNGVSKGTATGSATSIFNSNSVFKIGGPSVFLDSLIDEVRVWNDARTDQEIEDNYQTELEGTESNLVGYWKLNDDLLDETSNGNGLTNNNSAVFSSSVPFVGETTTSTGYTPTAYYLYEGNTGASYANPHALTTVSTTSSTTAHIYDNNGNLTSDETWTNTWDYNNKLLQSVNSIEGNTTTYNYDQSGQRVYKNENGVVSIYPNKYYTIEDGVVKKHIFAGDLNVASVEGATTTYHHTDHLSGSSVESDHEGYIVEILDYYPFGSTRIDEKYTDYENDKKFTGHEYDDATDLYYMGARYQDPEIGRFVSQDPVYLGTGTQGGDENGQKELRSYLSDPQGFNSPRTIAENGLNSVSGLNWRKNTIAGNNSTFGWAEYLADPQSQNSYAYARNNPLAYVDPDGEWALYFSFTTNAGLGGEAGNTLSAGIASDGTYGTSVSYHWGGLAGGDASIGGLVGVSNSKTWNDMSGRDYYVGGGVKVGVGIDVSANLSDNGDGFESFNIGGGVGPSTPVYLNGGLENTTILTDGNLKNDLSSAWNRTKSFFNKLDNKIKKGK